MSEPTAQLLADVLANVLEEAAFFMVEPEGVPSEQESDVFHATLDFESVRRRSAPHPD